MSNQGQIYHCSLVNLSGGGGIETYLSALLQHRIPGVSDRVLTSLKDLDLSQFKLLHFHNLELLSEFRGKCPAVYTLHNHNPYCPSGNKYFSRNGTCCNRQMSYLGCTWGHIVDGCGSRRPQNIIENLQRSHRELETLKNLKIPVIANSNYVREQLIKHGLPSEQTVTLYCGVASPKTFTEPLTEEIHQSQRILFAGRIAPNKGLEWLLKALARTSSRIHLDIAGEGWDRPRMEKLAQQLGASDRVTWHGWCEPQKLDSLYQQCFAVIFPSLWHEPAGLVTLEAYARYRPVIASAVGGIPEHLRDGETGILITANDIDRLADAIAKLSEDYEATRFMGLQGHKMFLEEFTMDVHIQHLQKIYDRCIERFFD
ncbi:MAG: glycosyltransferase family 4 protein [Cyanosarcina radialis HA8281-LM2]|jgi:glycosyltransferase involved in cell wall biosynthesis|nr:glycosyltransferase family 4 protein [Cyanosarcina radialis HA8281-LM2]